MIHLFFFENKIKFPILNSELRNNTVKITIKIIVKKTPNILVKRSSGFNKIIDIVSK